MLTRGAGQNGELCGLGGGAVEKQLEVFNASNMRANFFSLDTNRKLLQGRQKTAFDELKKYNQRTAVRCVCGTLGLDLGFSA